MRDTEGANANAYENRGQPTKCYEFIDMYVLVFYIESTKRTSYTVSCGLYV